MLLKIAVPVLAIILLTGCKNESSVPIPQNRAVVDSETLDSVLFTFNQTDRFTNSELIHGISIELSNQSKYLVETDFELNVDRFENGWNELETIDFFTKTHPYSLERNHRIRHTIYTGHFENELEPGRYRMTLDYLLTDEEINEQESYSIGAVFWIEE